MTQYTTYTATVQVSSGRTPPSLKNLRVTLTKLAKTVPADAEIVVEKFTYSYVENSLAYPATRVIASWSRYE